MPGGGGTDSDSGDSGVIELGVLETAAAGEPPPPAAVRAPRRPLVVALVVALAVLVAVGASATPGPSLEGPLWTTSVSLAGYSLGARNVYVSEPGAVSLAAMSRETGRVRWRIPLPEPLLRTEELAGGTVVVFTHTPGPNDETGRQTTATWLDADGRTLAVHHGNLIGVLDPGGLALLEANPAGPGCTDQPGFCVDLLAVDPVTGITNWRIGPIQPGAWFLGYDRAGRITTLATVGPDGSVMRRDPLTGAITQTLPLPELAGTGPVLTVAGTLVTTRRGQYHVDVTGFRLDPPRQVWTVAVPVPEPTELTWFAYASECGGMVCEHVAGGTVMLDPVTGQVRLEVPYEIFYELGSGLMVGEPPLRGAGNHPDNRRLFLVDPRTGAVRTTLTGLTGVGWSRSGGRALLSESGRFTAFVVLSADGALTRVGRVDETGLDCQADGEILACAEATGRLRVWRLPIPPPD